MREIRLRGRVDRDETGELAFAVGVVQDVSGPRNSERLHDARRALTRALDDWQSLEDGVVVLLHRFGERARAARRIAVDLVGGDRATRLPRDVERPGRGRREFGRRRTT